MRKLGIYIHIPFCASKCLYCDFNSCANKEALIPQYFEALLTEIENCKYEAEVSSIFIGGGTPSLVDSKYIGMLMDKLSKKFCILKDAEITIESNPGTLNIEKLRAYRSYGINRLSMGLQTVSPALLKVIGRRHSYEDFEKNYQDAIIAGFTNMNADLMFSLPNQTIKDWEESLHRVIGLGIAHISCYSLKVEEGTPFYKLYEDGTLKALSDEQDREMYELAKYKLAQNGYEHYEISNFAKHSMECVHNILYWKAEEYIGFGAGAHSYIDDYRYSNVMDLEEYTKVLRSGIKNELTNELSESLIINHQISKTQGDELGNELIVEKNYISKEESISEYIILGLRLISGVDKEEFMIRYGQEIMDVYGEKIKRLIEMKLVTEDKNKIKLTSKGLDLANQVMMEFI